MLTLKGIPIKKNEKPDQLLDSILRDIEKLKLEIEDFEVDRVHRNGPKYKDKDGKLQQDVILKFTSWQARNAFYNARQKTRYRVCPNLTKRCVNLLKYAETSVADPNNQLSQVINFVYVDRNCRLMAFTKCGRFLSFNTKAEFDLLLNAPSLSTSSNNIYDLIEEDLK